MSTPTPHDIRSAADPHAVAALRLTIATCPPREVMSNFRSSTWHARARGLKDYRAGAHAAAMVALMDAGALPLWCRGEGPIALSYVIVWPADRRRIDASNAIAAMKAVDDGIAQALGVNDTRFQFAGMTQCLATPDDHLAYAFGRTEITITGETP